MELGVCTFDVQFHEFSFCYLHEYEEYINYNIIIVCFREIVNFFKIQTAPAVLLLL